MKFKNRFLLLIENLFFLNFFIFLAMAFYSKRAVKICFVTGVFLWIILNILEHKKKFLSSIIPSTPLNKPILLFLIAAVLSVIFGIQPYFSQKIFFQRYLPYFLFFFLGYAFVSKSFRNLSIGMGVILFSGIIFSLGAIRDYLVFHPVRLFTVFGKNFIFLSEFLLIIMPLSFVLLFSKNLFIKILSVINFCLAIPVAVWHGARSIWITFAITFFILCLLNPRKFLPVYSFVLISLAVIILVTPSIRKRAFNLASAPLSRATLSDRPELFEAALDIFEKHPVFGAGPGSFELLYNPAQYGRKVKHLHAHDTYLEILAEMGLLGLGVYLFFIFSLYKMGIRKLSQISSSEHFYYFLALGGIITAYLVGSLGSASTLVGVCSTSLLWFFIGMFSAINSYEKDFV